MLRKYINITLCIALLYSWLGPYPNAQAQPLLGLPEPGTMVNLSSAYEPILIKGLRVDPKNPFAFDFILDTGSTAVSSPHVLSGDPAFKAEANKLIKYFLAAMTVPEKNLWVNLSPYEKDRMISNDLGQTEMGRDMLAQDYILKQLTASLIYPEKELGKKFWDKIYAQAKQRFGTTEVPVNTFNKVWIVADKADVFERANTAYIVGAHLKVMLEEDYLAKGKNQHTQASSISSQIVREIIVPEIEREVNHGKNFAPLRQMYYSMILASWYKMALKDALLTQVYGNQSKVKAGVNVLDATEKDKIFQRFLEAYKKGVFNYIKDMSVVIPATPQGGRFTDAGIQSQPRKYFSGGLDYAMMQAAIHRNQPWRADGAMTGTILNVRVNTAMVHDDSAMITSIPSIQDLVSIAKTEQVPVVQTKFGSLAWGLLLGESFDHGMDDCVEYMQRILNGPAINEFEKEEFLKKKKARGIITYDGLLADLAKRLGIHKDEFIAQLLEEGGLSLDVPYRDRFIAVESGDKLQQTLMEEVFHMLEGWGPAWRSRTDEMILEIVDDFLQLMFYSQDQLSDFDSAYTEWTLNEREALYKRYLKDLNLNPNTEMRSIIEALLRDLEQDIEIKVGDHSARLSDVFFHSAVSGTVGRAKYEYGTINYLRDLLKKERFSKYPKLFPAWKSAKKSEEISIIFPSSATDESPGVWEGIRRFIYAAAQKQGTVRLIVQPIHKKAKDSPYTYGDLFAIEGQIGPEALEDYDIDKENHTITLRIKEVGKYKKYVFALSSAGRDNPTIAGIIYKMELKDGAMTSVPLMNIPRVASDKKVSAQIVIEAIKALREDLKGVVGSDFIGRAIELPQLTELDKRDPEGPYRVLEGLYRYLSGALGETVAMMPPQVTKGKGWALTWTRSDEKTMKAQSLQWLDALEKNANALISANPNMVVSTFERSDSILVGEGERSRISTPEEEAKWEEGSRLFDEIDQAFKQFSRFANQQGDYEGLIHAMGKQKNLSGWMYEQARNADRMSQKLYDDMSALAVFEDLLDKYSNPARVRDLSKWAEKFIGNYEQLDLKAKLGLHFTYLTAKFIRQGGITEEFISHVLAVKAVVDKNKGRIQEIAGYFYQRDNARAITPGGIDLDRSKMQMNVNKQGDGVQMQFDPAMIQRIKRDGFDGIEFRIESIVPISNLPVFLGLAS